MMEMFVVYHHPTDYPDKFVVRRWVTSRIGPLPDSEWFFLGETLEEVRAKIAPLCLHCIRRHPNDEPQIVEVWI
jgi:hypothetical protein